MEPRPKPVERKPANDPVNHPSHYTSGNIEVIDFILDQKLGFELGNSVKYIARAGKKDPDKEIEDLNKALWYLTHRINQLRQQQEGKESGLFDEGPHNSVHIS